MNQPIISAGIDFTTLIYIIVMVVWVFGKMLSKKNKKGNSRPGERRPPAGSSAEVELREFLERMSGQREEPEEEEFVEVSPPQPVLIVKRKETTQEDHYRTEEPSSPPPPAYVPKPVMPDVQDEMKANVTHRSPAGMGAAFASALRSSGSQFKLTEANISILKQSMRSTHPQPLAPVVTRKELKSRKMFRKAMAAKIILGTPRAFETQDVPEAIRH